MKANPSKSNTVQIISLGCSKNLVDSEYLVRQLRAGDLHIIHHEVVLWEKKLGNSVIKPHVFYNFLYRKTTIPEIGPDLKPSGDLATYTTFEHHIGAGVKWRLSGKMYMNLDCGYGVYLGSIKKPTAFNSITGEVRGSDGFGMIAQLGIGYNIF